MRANGARVEDAFVVARVKKRSRDLREQNSRPVFSGLRHGGAEKKFNRTGGTAGKTLAGGLALRETVTRIRYRRIESRAASAERSHQAGGSDSRVKTSFHGDLLSPRRFVVTPFSAY